MTAIITKKSAKPTLRAARILAIMAELYPNPRSELDFSDEFQLIVAVVLSAQCTDKKVNQVTPFLFSKFPNPKELGAATVAEIEKIIRPINYYKTKAKHLKALGSLITEQFNGSVPRTMEDLIALPGVGRKTASVVLSELGVENAFPVDTHVFRVSKRLEIASGRNVTEVEQSLRQHFAPELWRPLHHWLIFHGRRVCKAQRPRCGECALAKLCPVGKKNAD